MIKNIQTIEVSNSTAANNNSTFGYVDSLGLIRQMIAQSTIASIKANTVLLNIQNEAAKVQTAEIKDVAEQATNMAKITDSWWFKTLAVVTVAFGVLSLGLGSVAAFGILGSLEGSVVVGSATTIAGVCTTTGSMAQSAIQLGWIIPAEVKSAKLTGAIERDSALVDNVTSEKDTIDEKIIRGIKDSMNSTQLANSVLADEAQSLTKIFKTIN